MSESTPVNAPCFGVFVVWNPETQGWYSSTYGGTVAEPGALVEMEWGPFDGARDVIRWVTSEFWETFDGER